MTHQDFGHHRRTPESVTHSKEDALSEREFELLWEGANKMDGYRGTEARFIVLVGGRLGLRAGEVAHFLDSWVNRREKLVEIPGHQECTKGKDGGRCGYCRQQIKQCVEYNGVEWEEVAGHWWRPKTEAGIRGVPYDFEPRAELAIERFLDEFDRFERSYTAIGRRVKRAAECAPELDPDDIYPHALRATAATYHVGRGLQAHPLASLMGWSNLSTAEAYIQRSDENTRRAVRSTHNR